MEESLKDVMVKLTDMIGLPITTSVCGKNVDASSALVSLHVADFH